MKNYCLSYLLAALITLTILTGFATSVSAHAADGFMGMWTLSIEDGAVGWLEVHEKEGYLDANLLWRGGSVLPVSHVYMVDDNHLVVTRTREVQKSKEAGKERSHIVTYTLRIKRDGDKLSGNFIAPKPEGGESSMSFTGVKLPPVPSAPNLASLNYGKPIKLFNGKNLKGWTMVNPDHQNGFKVHKKTLVNDPVQNSDHHVHYGNLRTVNEFEDFRLTLDVNVPAGNNSGVYLRGMYEIQVYDSYGKDRDSHHMGALYSRITPSVSAEKPGGEWQSLDMILCDRHVTVKLNGTTIIDNQPVYGPTGGAIIADVFAPGPIYLQGDHGKVSYRNIVLTPIEK